MVPAELRRKNKLTYPFIKVCFHYQDFPLAEKLHTLLGGRLVWNKTKTYVVWWITQSQDLISICDLINGFLRTPKIYKFHELLTFLNNHWNQDFALLKLDQSSLESNAWLSGITDADGNFSLLVSLRKKKPNLLRVQLFYRLELKQQNKSPNNSLPENQLSFFGICSKIATFLKVSLYSRVRELNGKSFGSYIVITHNEVSRQVAVDYFQKYPLRSTKYLNFKDWLFIHKMPKPLSPENKEICLKIQQNFNSKRKTFCWKHLEDWKF